MKLIIYNRENNLGSFVIGQFLLKKMAISYHKFIKMLRFEKQTINQTNDIAVINIAMAMMKAIILSSTCNIDQM